MESMQYGKWNLNYVQCLNITPTEKTRFMAPMEYNFPEKALWIQWNIPLWLIAPMEKTWFYERLFFEMVMVTV